MNIMKKVLFINGSPNKNGHTVQALKIVEEKLKANNIDTVWINIGNKPVRGCISCMWCKKDNHNRCTFNDDPANEIIEKLLASDGVVIGTPTYFAGPNGALTAVLDRVFYAATVPAQLFRGKVGAVVATCFRSGATDAVDRINKYYQFASMPVASSSYWPLMFDEESPYGHDDKGIEVLKELGDNMAKMLGE